MKISKKLMELGVSGIDNYAARLIQSSPSETLDMDQMEKAGF